MIMPIAPTVKQPEKEAIRDYRFPICAIITELAAAKCFKADIEKPTPRLSQEEEVLLEERRKLLEWQGEYIRGACDE